MSMTLTIKVRFRKKFPSEGEKKKHEEVMKPNANGVGEVRKREK